MAFPDLQATRQRLKALATELVELSATYEPTPPGSIGHEHPIFIRARALLTEAQTPFEHTAALCTTIVEAASVRTLIHLGVFDNIPDNASISLGDLSQKTGVQESLLQRLLRAPILSGLIHQNGDVNLSHTRISRDYRSDGFTTRFMSLLYDHGLRNVIRLPQYLDHQRQATGKYEEPGASRGNSLFNMTTWEAGVEGEKTTFQLMEEDEAKFKGFQKLLDSAKHLNPYVGFYDFSKLASDEPDRIVLCDVGGGHGHSIVEILKAHPQIKPEQCALQDTAAVVEYAKTSNQQLPAGVKFQVHDFFTPQPIKHARAYYLRAIAHDLSDINLVKVLKHIVVVMAPDSKVLISENVIPEAGFGSRAIMQDMLM